MNAFLCNLFSQAVFAQVCYHTVCFAAAAALAAEQCGRQGPHRVCLPATGDCHVDIALSFAIPYAALLFEACMCNQACSHRHDWYIAALPLPESEQKHSVQQPRKHIALKVCNNANTGLLSESRFLMP